MPFYRLTPLYRFNPLPADMSPLPRRFSLSPGAARRAAVRRLPALVCALLLWAPTTAFAQEDPSKQPVLPDIAPRVVEIRGQLEISFPSLQRQPLIGFNPPPQVVPIPPDRKPWADAYKQAKADLPPSPLRPPQAPEVSPLKLRTPRNGEVEGSFGRYVSRLFRARTDWVVSPQAALYTRLDYRGTEGHQPDYLGTEAVDASFDALEGLVGLQTTTRGAVMGVEVDGFLNDFPLYAASLRLGAAAAGDAPGRRGQGLGSALWLRTQGATPLDGRLRLHYGQATYRTDYGDDLDDPAYRRTERRLTADGALAAPLGEATEARVEARAATAGLDAGGFVGNTTRLLDAMGGFHYRYGPSFDLAVGLRVLTFTSGAQHPGAEPSGAARGTYVAPDLRLNFYPDNRVTFYVQNRPRLEFNTLADLFRQNPYLVNEPLVLPTVRTLNAEGGGEVFLGPAEVALRVGYLRSPNFLYFERATEAEAGGYDHGFFVARYDRTEVLHVGGDVSVVLPAGLNASVGLTYRQGRLLDADADKPDAPDAIPNFAPLVGRAALSYAFLDNRGLVQLNGVFERARYRDRAQSRRLGDFFDLDVALSYNLSTALGVVVRAENLSAGYLERWDRYEQAPFVLMGGFRVLW